MAVEKKRIGVISLGCDKNRTDTEKMLAKLKAKHTLVNDLAEAQVVIINTCAFLESSRKEAVEEILSVAEYKASGTLEKLIVTGCLPQKFIDEIYSALPEVDAFLGVYDYDKILKAINGAYQGKRINAVGNEFKFCGVKRVLTTKNYAYLKIADGCDKHCTYCLIPSIRGKFRSIKKELLLKEAKALKRVEELILVAQDITEYGKDLVDTNLVGLIKELSALDNVKKIRLLYCYPEGITDELIYEIKTNPKVIKYIDIPLQHADDRILKLMNRKGTGNEYLALIEKIREQIPNIAIRSTFITGFPTEDDVAFENLVQFIKQAKLFNVGFFKYSREDGTPAFRLNGQVEEKLKNKRLKKLYSVQRQVVNKNYKSLIGKTVSVVAEGFDENMMTYYGRAYFNAPDIDGKIYFFSKKEVKAGKTYNVKLSSFNEYDFYGERI